MSIHDLPFDILDEVVSYLPVPALQICCLVSSNLRNVSLPYVFREIVIHSGIPLPPTSESSEPQDPLEFDGLNFLFDGHNGGPHTLDDDFGLHSELASDALGLGEPSSSVFDIPQFESGIWDDGPDIHPLIVEEDTIDVGPSSLDAIQTQIHIPPSQIAFPSTHIPADDDLMEDLISDILGSIECRRFCDILEHNPELGQYVLTLNLVQGSSHEPLPDSDFWITAEVDRVVRILAKLPNLTSFALSKNPPIQISLTNIAWSSLPLRLTEALLKVFCLPSLKYLDLSFGFSFQDPAEFSTEFNIRPLSNIKSLTISCMLFQRGSNAITSPTKRDLPPAKLDYLELNYMGSEREGPELVAALSDPNCPFDIRSLKELVVKGVNNEDEWISILLGMQKTPKRLKRLSLHSIFKLNGPLPFTESLRRLTSLNYLSVSAELQTLPFGEFFYEWLSPLPVYDHLEKLRIVTSVYRGRLTHLGQLDEFISHEGGMPKLKEIEVALVPKGLNFYFDTDDDKGILDDDDMRECIPEWFTKCRNKGILKVSMMDRSSQEGSVSNLYW